MLAGSIKNFNTKIPMMEKPTQLHNERNDLGTNIPKDNWLYEGNVHAVDDTTMGLRDLVPSISNSLSTILLLLSA